MSANPNKSNLDFQNIFQRAFDESTDRLRTDSTATIVTPPAIEVAIDAATDNIAIIGISDGTDSLNINSDGSLNVNVNDATDEQVISLFAEQLSVLSAVDTLILSYTVPSSHNLFLNIIEVSGENIAMYEIRKNGIAIARKRTYFGGGLNEQFNFYSTSQKGLEFNPGDILQARVLHNRPDSATFEARIQGILKG